MFWKLFLTEMAALHASCRVTCFDHNHAFFEQNKRIQVSILLLGLGDRDMKSVTTTTALFPLEAGIYIKFKIL